MTARRDETAKPTMDVPLMDGHDHAALAAIAPSQALRRLLLLDEMRLTRDCLAETIQDLCPDMEVVGASPADFQTQAGLTPVALLVFNLHHAPIHVAVAALRLHAAQAMPPMLFITTRDERSEALQAMQHGVAGLVRADARIELLIAAIRLVIAGGRYFPADILAALMTKTQPARHSL